jgi:demethylmenaquinone methyltransferase/2-methoxy-6-polyprenyl-1,4-benzoquinol methylase
MNAERTQFGYEQVSPEEKSRRVRGVFDSVARKYDVMNDVMSGGLHRAWKRFALEVSGVRPGQRVLDLAGGTGDVAALFADRVGANGLVVHTDINGAMLAEGRDKLLDRGIILPTIQCNAEALPFPARVFDVVSIASSLTAVRQPRWRRRRSHWWCGACRNPIRSTGLKSSTSTTMIA